MKKLLLIFIFFISLTGCSIINRKPPEMTSYLKALNSYSVDMDIKVINQRQNLEYSGRQMFLIGLGYKLELNNDKVMIYRDDKIYVTDLYNKQKYVTDENFDDVLRLSFLGEFIGLFYTNQNIEKKYVQINDMNYELIKTSLNCPNRNLSYGILYINISDKKPEKLSIYDYKGNEKLLITYKNFEANAKLSKTLFDINK